MTELKESGGEASRDFTSGRSEALELAHWLVASSSAHETEVTVESTRDRFVRFADCGPTQSADRERVDVSVRVRLAADGNNGVGGEQSLREAKASACGLERRTLESSLQRALELASHSRPNPELVELGGAVEVARTLPLRSTWEHGFEAKSRWVDSAVEACARAGFAPAGLARTTGVERTIVNSRGRAVQGATSRASFSLTASALDGGHGSGFAEQITDDVDELDAQGVIARALQKATDGADPRAIDAGEYTVVLEPAAVSSLLLFATYQGFGAQEVEEQASFLCGRIGRPVFCDSLTILDDAYHPAHPGFPFDAEGTPRQRVSLVERGVPGEPVTDRAFGAKRGAESTGHALPQPSSSGPRPQNLVLMPGEKSMDELISGVERGLLVTQFHYTNVIEPRDLTLTGMTRNGTFLIEGGRVRQAVGNLRFTQSLTEALARVRGVGSQLEVAGALFDGEVLAPALCIDRFRFTSTSEC